MSDRWEDLKSNAQTGADLSPGDPVAAWAAAEIERLRAEIKRLNGVVDLYEKDRLSRVNCNTGY